MEEADEIYTEGQGERSTRVVVNRRDPYLCYRKNSHSDWGQYRHACAGEEHAQLEGANPGSTPTYKVPPPRS